MSDDQNPPVTAAVTLPPGLVMPPGWDVARAAALIHDLAVAMYPEPVILQKHGLTTPHLDLLKTNEMFNKALEAAVIDWHKPTSVVQRLGLEAAVSLEHALPTLAARMEDTKEPFAGVIEAAKLFAKIAGAGEQKSATHQPGERFVINIDLGADKQIVIEKSLDPIEVQPSGTAVSPVFQTSGSPAPLQIDVKGPRNGS